jgi:hypothetical protein
LSDASGSHPRLVGIALSDGLRQGIELLLNGEVWEKKELP